jgi:hypothetical protein
MAGEFAEAFQKTKEITLLHRRGRQTQPHARALTRAQLRHAAVAHQGRQGRVQGQDPAGPPRHGCQGQRKRPRAPLSGGGLARSQVLLSEKANVEQKGDAPYLVGPREVVTDKGACIQRSAAHSVVSPLICPLAGTRIQADLVFFATGPRPNTDALGAGLRAKLADNGRIKVNEL